MARAKKTAVLAGLIVVFTASAVMAQPPPPPPPPEGGGGGYYAPVPPPPPPPPPARPAPRWYRARLVFNLSFPLMIQGELALGRWVTLLAGIGGFAIKAGDDGDGFYWLDTMVGLNIHFTGWAPRGWWIGLRSHNGWMAVTGNETDNDKIYIGAAKLLLGYTWIWRSRFSLGLGLGVQYFYIGLADSDTDVFVEGIWPAGELTLGVAF